MIAQMSVQIILALNIIRMLKLVDSANLSFVDASRIGSNPFSDKYNIYLFIYYIKCNIAQCKYRTYFFRLQNGCIAFMLTRLEF